MTPILKNDLSALSEEQKLALRFIETVQKTSKTDIVMTQPYLDLVSKLLKDISISGGALITDIQNDIENINNNLTETSRNIEAHNAEIKSVSCGIDNAGHHRAISYNSETMPMVCGFRLIIHGNGVPGSDTIPEQKGIPQFIGQLYIDMSVESGGLYYATGTTSVSNWKKA